MSYPDWVPMWLRTAMGRKCEDLAELAVPVTMAVDGQERFTMATFGPIAWRVPDGCGEPKGMMTAVRVKRDRPFDFVACKHRPNARSLLYRSSDGLVYPTGAESFDARCMDAVVAQFPKVRWSLPFVAQYLCAFDGDPAEDLENLVAIVRSHGKHFDVKSKKRAESLGPPSAIDGISGGHYTGTGGEPQQSINVFSRPAIYDVNTLSGVPVMRATWVGPVVRFEFKEARLVPQLGEVFRVGFDPRSRWKAKQQQRDRGDTWIDARLAADGDSKLAEDITYEPAVVEHAVRLIADEMAESRRHAEERAKTVSPAERDAKMAPPSIMVSLLKAKPGESLMFKWSAEAGALLTNANGESVGHIETRPRPQDDDPGAIAQTMAREAT